MSLLDGLLLDPHRDPREIWLARRTDGQKGSGTIADPYDGSKTLGPPMAASLTLKWNEFVVDLGDTSSEDAHVDGNLVGVTDPHLVSYTRSRNVNMFNNLTLAGKAVPLAEDTSGAFTTFEGRNTFDDMIDGALVISLL